MTGSEHLKVPVPLIWISEVIKKNMPIAMPYYIAWEVDILA